MDLIARKSNAERTELFREAANSKGVHFQIIEKDFWVCWTLKRLFSLSEIGSQLIFKGGTSLSKAYHVVERFSEDIDVAIDRAFLGFGSETDLQSLSSNKRNRTIKELDETCKKFVQTQVLESLQNGFSAELGNESGEWQLLIAGDDPYGQTILFFYPRDHKNPLGTELEYVRPFVRIEMGDAPRMNPLNSFLSSVMRPKSSQSPLSTALFS